MEYVKLSYKCSTCKVKLERIVRAFHPDDFSKTGTKSVLFQSWCDKCKEPIALRYGFKIEHGKIVAEVLRHIKQTASIVPKKQKEGDLLTARPGGKSKGGSYER